MSNINKPGHLPNNKAELLEHIQKAWDALENELSRINDKQMAVAPPSGWSVKDHLAHLAVWEMGVTALLNRRPRFSAMNVEDAVSAGKSEDEVNEIIFQRMRSLTAADALALLKKAHSDMLATLEIIDSADLFRPYSFFLPAGEAGPDEPVIHWIIGNTYEHYELHLGYIRYQEGSMR